MGGEAGDVFTFLDPEEGRKALGGKVGRDWNAGWAGDQAFWFQSRRSKEKEEGAMQRKRFRCKSEAALAEQMLGLLQLWSCDSLGISLGKDDIRSEKYRF